MLILETFFLSLKSFYLQSTERKKSKQQHLLLCRRSKPILDDIYSQQQKTQFRFTLNKKKRKLQKSYFKTAVNVEYLFAKLNLPNGFN